MGERIEGTVSKCVGKRKPFTDIACIITTEGWNEKAFILHAKEKVNSLFPFKKKKLNIQKTYNQINKKKIPVAAYYLFSIYNHSVRICGAF